MQRVKSSTQKCIYVEVEEEASYFLPKFIERAAFPLDCYLYGFMLSFLCIIFGVFVSSRVILGSLKKKVWRSNYFSRVFWEVFDVALTLLLRRSKRSWRSAALRVLRGAVFLAFATSVQKETFCHTQVLPNLTYVCICFSKDAWKLRRQHEV